MLNLKPDIPFINYFRLFNIISLILILISLGSIFYKGLNFGVDFKGGTLIELRVDNDQIRISEVREAFLKMNLGDVNVKKFGKEGDYLIKFEKKNFDDKNNIKTIKKKKSLKFLKTKFLW